LLDNDKIRKVVEAAKLYYQMDYSQNQIADALGVSRPTVSRLLQQAKAEGIVTIEIKDPTEDVEVLRFMLKERFHLKNAVVAFTPTYEEAVVKKYIGQAAASYIVDLVKDGDTIGASWGSTMYQVALHLKTKSLNNSLVVQLNGGVSDADVQISPSEIVHLFVFHVFAGNCRSHSGEAGDADGSAYSPGYGYGLSGEYRRIYGRLPDAGFRAYQFQLYAR
jgi:deoxyribonucleoside regulator